MKRIKFLGLFFVFTILMLVFPNIVNAATTQATETTNTSTGKVVNWSYELDSNNNILNLKCTNISSISGELTIPSTIDGHNVVTIGREAFENCSGLTGITIPDIVTSIGYRAFYNCAGLKSLTLPNSVTNIQSYAFTYCSGIKNVTFSENLASIGEFAFWGCSGFKTIVIPNSVTTIGNGAFEDCAGITSLTLSSSLTKISDGTFRGCSGITSVTIPESVTTIGDSDLYGYGAFQYCSNLEKILIPDSIATIKRYSFDGCKKLTIYGNEGQASKNFAETYSINFKLISQWDESNVGDDITPPYVKSILVPHSSVYGYYDSNSTTYIVPSGKVLIINVNFSENILATEIPKLTIRFGSGSNIELTEGTVSGSTVAYTYTIAKNDVGTMAAVSLEGGNITDEAGNAATLSCPKLEVSIGSNYYIYANGTAVDIEDGNNNKDNDNSNDNKENNNVENANNGSQAEQNGNNANQEEKNNDQANNNKENDSTIKVGGLPRTGVGIFGFFIFMLLVIGAIFVYVKYRNLRDI